MAAPYAPHIVILAGPNGAGKSTAAPRLLKGALRVAQFVNADTIARGLAGFDPESTALQAGRIMLERLRDLAATRQSFAFETTLASRTFLPWLRKRRRENYAAHLLFLSLPSADIAIARVRERVARGGHDVPEKTIRDRFRRGLQNLFGLYLPAVTTWRVYDNSKRKVLRMIALGGEGVEPHVAKPIEWGRLKELARER